MPQRLIIGFLLLLPLSLFASTDLPRPKLIVTIVIDQFRADYLTRFKNEFVQDGFQRLMSEGAYYPYGKYGHLITETCPGHAAILTGSFPRQNGIPENTWYDPASHETAYCVEDFSHHLIGATAKDHHAGTSPRNLNASTVGDEIKLAQIPSRSVSIAIKDRAAMLLGGHAADLALWLNVDAFQWVSSDYYFPSGKLPGWLVPINQEIHSHVGQKIDWDGHIAEIGKKSATLTPYGSEITEALTEKAMDAEGLGLGDRTDVLTVSFSSHDWAGHQYGPNSREMEDMTLAEDRLIAKLLRHIDERVGFDHTVIVLTGDHGIPPSIEFARSMKLDAGYLRDDDLSRVIEKALTARFGKSPTKAWVASVETGVWLDHDAIARKHLALDTVQSAAKEAVLKLHGVARVFTSSEANAGRIGDGLIERKFLNGYVPGKSPDLTVVTNPYFMEDGDPVSHGSPYAYDSTVPIVFYGPRYFKPGLRAESAEVIDIAPTLSFVSGVLPPSQSEGRVLSEALR